MEGPEIEHPHHHHTGRSWLDVILGVSAVVISFISLEYSAEDYEAMRTGVQKVNFRTCYCSVFDECWMADNFKPRPAKVKECPVAARAF